MKVKINIWMNLSKIKIIQGINTIYIKKPEIKNNSMNPNNKINTNNNNNENSLKKIFQ